MRIIFMLLVFKLTWQFTYAQKTVDNQSLIWYGYFQNLKINDRFSIHTDFQERHFIAPVSKQSQFVVRTIFKTRIASNWDAGVGFCFFLTNTDPTVTYNLETPELRPQIELSNKQKLKHVTVSHRFRLEARFFHNTSGDHLVDGYNFGNMRVRYQLGVELLLRKPKEEKHALRLRLMDEMMLNFGKKIKYNMFDQNRVYVALQYSPSPAITLEAGYMNWFQQRASGDKFFNRQIFRFNIIHQIDLKAIRNKKAANKQ
jgi:hypothetical protein